MSAATNSAETALLADNARLRGAVEKLKKAVIAERGARIAALVGFDPELIGPALSKFVSVDLDDAGGVAIGIIDRHGKPRVITDQALAEEFATAHPSLQPGVPAEHTGEQEPKESDDALWKRLKAEHGGIKPVLTEDERRQWRKRNPFLKEFENLTAQMKALRYAPELAADLQRSAGIA